jgi:hypothetical protein
MGINGQCHTIIRLKGAYQTRKTPYHTAHRENICQFLNPCHAAAQPDRLYSRHIERPVCRGKLLLLCGRHVTQLKTVIFAHKVLKNRHFLPIEKKMKKVKIVC